MSDWFIKLGSSSSKAKLRLFLLHYAGGSATIFNGWEKYFGSDVDVIALQLPGRDRRFKEPPISNMPEVLEQLVDEFTPYMDLPCILFGHSMGALISYELVRKLESRFSGKIVHLVLSALRAPNLPDIRPPVYNLPYNEMIDALKGYSSDSGDILDNPEIMQEFMPMLRADFSICDTYYFNRNPKVSCRVSLFSGTKDRYIPIEDASAWQCLVAQTISYFEFDGGHFFIRNHKEECLNILHNIVLNEVDTYMSKFEVIL